MFLANEFARAEIEPDDRWGSDKRKQAPALGLFEPEMRRVMRGNDRLRNRKADAYSRVVVLKKLSKARSRFATQCPVRCQRRKKAPRRFIERRLDVDPGIGCPDCAIDWTRLNSRLMMITCCN
jgi:hypothetical protein